MNLAIEFHDSELTSMGKRGDVLQLRLNAYIHKSEGRPGVDAGTGWWQDTQITVERGVVEGPITNWPAEMYDGVLEIDGERFDNGVPVPFERVGEVRLTLKLSYDDPFVVLGSGVRVELSHGAPVCIEEFPGTNE